MTLKLTNGYVVLAIPDSGLFVKNGCLVTGHNKPIGTGKLILFSRIQDAEKQQNAQKSKWKDGDKNGHKWDFPIIPVLVDERLEGK